MSTGEATETTAIAREAARRAGGDPLQLVQVLREIQGRLAHIPEPAIEVVANDLRVPHTQVRGVIEFYAFLHERPRGRYEILLSDNIVDRMLGKQAVMDRLCARLGVRPGETRADGRVSVSDTSCTGMPDQGPAGLVNGRAVTRLTPERVEQIAELVEAEVPLEAWPDGLFKVEDNIRRRDHLLQDEFVPGSALAALAELGPDAVLEEVAASGLRGMGGAGFKTATKWSLCRRAPAAERYVVCNADEGEPGTFKDRVLLQSYADLVLEGMTVCGGVLGARRGFLYLRAEYAYLLAPLSALLERRRRDGLLGRRVAGIEGFDFDIEIQLGAGAYICGEESALLESLEGKRGVARVRPPFPVTHGYRDRPTVVNNVETLAAAAWIAVRGAAWNTALGTPASPGTKLLSISGDCARPGVYEYPFGVRLCEVLEDCGASDTQAVQIAGAAGHCLGEAELDRCIAFEDLATGGSFMVFNRRRDLLDMARNFARFFAHESCGFCTPCRVGTALMRDLVDKLYEGHATQLDLDEMRRLAEVMTHTSQCGLGQTAANPIIDLLDRFPEAYMPRLRCTDFEPAFDLDGALTEARRLTGRA